MRTTKPAIRRPCAVIGRLALLAAVSVLVGATEPSPGPATPAPLAPAATTPVVAEGDTLEEIVVEAPEPRYVSPTRRDRIGRV